MKSVFQLLRWKNLLFIAVIIWLMEKMVIVPILNKAMFGEQLPHWILYLIILSVVFIAAAGYAINDYFDVKIDNINRPDKLVVTKSISKHQAMLFHQTLTVLGVILGLISAFYLRSFTLGIIYIFVPGLLWFYSSSYKRQFIIGNLIVALTTALTPMMPAIANVAYLNHTYTKQLMQYSTLEHDIYLYVGVFSLFAFLTTLAREIIKDLQDQTGDRELECHTLPIVIGNTWTKLIVVLILLITICLTLFFVCKFHTVLGLNIEFSSPILRYFIFGFSVPMLCELYLVVTAKLSSDFRFAQQLLKFIMLLGVLFSILFSFIYN